jgi:hypothetical protein
VLELNPAYKRMTLGLPQVSTLGPLLFLLYLQEDIIPVMFSVSNDFSEVTSVTINTKELKTSFNNVNNLDITFRWCYVIAPTK